MRLETLVLLVRALRNLVSGLLVLFLFMTLVAIVMKIRGTMPWSTLGVWFLMDVAALIARRVLNAVLRRGGPRPAPRVS